MDLEKRARRQSRRVIISEVLMTITVIATVCILVLIVSGYGVNSDFKVERQGLLQISSHPTGADVEIDGVTGSWLQRTNTSKTLAAGEHTITLKKDGYDSWSRTINITKGLLYRIHYPRLFPLERTPETVYDFSVATFATISPDRNTLLLANNTSSWALLNLDAEKLEGKPLTLPDNFPGVTNAVSSGAANAASPGTFSGEILSANWASDNEHLLLKLNAADETIWYLLNVKNPAASVNLTSVFNLNFSRLEIMDNSASTLLALVNGALRRLDVPARQISAVLAENVYDFDYYNSEVLFSTETYLGSLKLGDPKITTLAAADSPSLVALFKFYDDEYIATLTGANLKLYKKADFEPIQTYDLSFSPKTLKTGHDGEFLTMLSEVKMDGSALAFSDAPVQIATLDLEAQAVTEWSPGAAALGWLDSDMFYAVSESGALSVYDFDGANRRVLATSANPKFPVAITADKWLYYASVTNATNSAPTLLRIPLTD